MISDDLVYGGGPKRQGERQKLGSIERSNSAMLPGFEHSVRLSSTSSRVRSVQNPTVDMFDLIQEKAMVDPTIHVCFWGRRGAL